MEERGAESARRASRGIALSEIVDRSDTGATGCERELERGSLDASLAVSSFGAKETRLGTFEFVKQRAGRDAQRNAFPSPKEAARRSPPCWCGSLSSFPRFSSRVWEGMSRVVLVSQHWDLGTLANAKPAGSESSDAPAPHRRPSSLPHRLHPPSPPGISLHPSHSPTQIKHIQRTLQWLGARTDRGRRAGETKRKGACVGGNRGSGSGCLGRREWLGGFAQPGRFARGREGSCRSCMGESSCLRREEWS